MPIVRLCEWCGGEFETHPSRAKRGRGRFCSLSCRTHSQWASKGLTDPSGYKRVRVRGHPLAGADGVVAEHRVVLYERVGPGLHPCHWCGALLEWRVDRNRVGQIIADHLDGDIHNNDPENLVPACHSCNALREHPKIIGDAELFIVKRNGTRHRASPARMLGMRLRFSSSRSRQATRSWPLLL
jgi:hypothetical protein